MEGERDAFHYTVRDTVRRLASSSLATVTVTSAHAAVWSGSEWGGNKRFRRSRCCLDSSAFHSLSPVRQRSRGMFKSWLAQDKINIFQAVYRPLANDQDVVLELPCVCACA